MRWLSPKLSKSKYLGRFQGRPKPDVSLIRECCDAAFFEQTLSVTLPNCRRCNLARLLGQETRLGLECRPTV